jgi:DNA helicase II / ATP-dependent DNA helicase PcrA
MIAKEIARANPPQQEAIIAIEGPILILAGAGTGKTRVITLRYLNMIQRGIKPDQIVALTFTNKAAREMKERISTHLPDIRKQLQISTFHSFCLRLIRENPADFDLHRGFTLISGADQVDIARKVIEDHKWQSSLEPGLAIGLISRFKNSQLPKQLKALLSKHVQEPTFDSMTYELAKSYDQLLRINRAIDFDDCILRVTQKIDSDPALRTKLQERFRYIMVDEYQDSNFLQLGLVYLLSSEHRNICVVGDDDQSIYSWRGAVSQNIALFETLFPTVRLIKLEQNYRCSTVILQAANAVIENNSARMGKALWCEKNSNHPITLSAHDTDHQESQAIAEKIMSLKGGGGRYGDIAILYRSNALSKSLEVALRTSRIPYKVFGGQSMFEKKEVRDFLAFLRLICDDNDLMAFWRIINVPHRGFGMRAIEQVDSIAREHNCSPFQVLKTQNHRLSPALQKAAASFVAPVESIRQLPDQTPEQIQHLAKQCIKQFELSKEVRSRTKDVAKLQAKLQFLNSLPDWIMNAAANHHAENDRCSLAEVLKDLALDDSPKQEDKDSLDKVSLMTIHAAKGLEFEHVFLCGLEEGILPHKNSVLEGKTDEERRLFYVAITRAKESLHLSYALNRGIAAHQIRRMPSTFLKEIPADLIGKPEISSQPTEERKKTTMTKLSSLRSMLKDGSITGR